MTSRPSTLFDRTAEWSDLATFVDEPTHLGVVWGPRRAGKSTLLAALSDAVGGLYFEATRGDASLALADLADAVARRTGVGGVRYSTWSDALAALTTLPGRPVVVLDEFGYLCEASPELPSVVQRVVDTNRRAGGVPCRLILCGSSVAQLSHLLDRDQPLFGRAQLATVIEAFDVRTAADFWGLRDHPRLAFNVHAVLGGLPGYRDTVGRGPAGLGARFDSWVTDRVLAASSPLLEEDTLVLDTTGLEANVYRSILVAVARGDRTPTGIASRLGRTVTSLARPIERLTSAGLLLQVADPLRSRRSRYELADPFLVFHDAVIRPHRTRLRLRQQTQVWADVARTWHSQILGPHFERVCREVVLRHGTEFGVAGVTEVGTTTVADARNRTSHELDVVAVDASRRIVGIGEAKHAAAARTTADLDRLVAIRALLPREEDRRCRLLLFSAAGFSADLRRLAAARTDTELVDFERLYATGSS